MYKITKGEDRTLNIFFTSQSSGRPYDLTGWTGISAFFKTEFGGTLEKNNIAYDTYAVALYQGITFTAITAGTVGNTISLVFNNTSTIQQIIDVWNTANPANQVTSDASNPSQVLPAATVNLADAQDDLIDLIVVSELLGQIRVVLHDFDTVQLLAGRSLSFKVVIDKGAPPEGERRKIIFENALEIVEDNV